MSSSSKVELFRDRLLEEQPKVDSALKSFASLLVAKGATTGEHDFERCTWNLMECLKVTRHVSKHINQHIVAIGAGLGPIESKKDQNSDLHLNVTQQVWNELVASKQKPTKLLGRTALRLIWDDLDLEKALLSLDTSTIQDDEKDGFWRNRVTSYVRQFHALLIVGDDDDHGEDIPSDSALLWHADRGASELARRATERQERAAQQRQQPSIPESTTSATTIIATITEDIIPEEEG